MKNAILLLLVLVSTYSFGQTKTKNDSLGVKLFDRAFNFYNEGKLDSALVLWTEIVEKNISKQYDTYGSAFFNVPTLYWQLKKYDQAKEWYKKILASDLRDNDETGSLMEPHTNYKHRAALALAGLYKIDSNYTEVLNWIYKADTLYRYWGFEGSATNISMEQAYLLDWKTRTLLNLNKKEEAIQAIIIELICSGHLESFFEKSENMMLSLIDKKSFNTEFNSALENLVIKNIDKNNWLATFTLRGLVYTIPISNIYPGTNIPHYWTKYFISKNETPDKLKLIEYIKKRSFYSELKK